MRKAGLKTETVREKMLKDGGAAVLNAAKV